MLESEQENKLQFFHDFSKLIHQYKKNTEGKYQY